MANTAFGAATQHRFSEIPRAEIPRSVFDRSAGVKTSFDAGYLVPVFVDEVLPGDTFKLRTTAVLRMSTPIFPVMDNIYADFFYFFVPNRLVWENWAKFCGEQLNPGDSTDFEIPQMPEAVAEGSLSDQFGLPLSATAYDHSALPHRCYNLIFREWFRSEDLQDSPVVDTDDGPDNPADYVLRRRTKRHDYFSSCLPFTQKGDPVLLPLGTSAPLAGSASITSTGAPTFTAGSGVIAGLRATTGSTAITWEAAMGAPGQAQTAWSNPALGVNLAGVTVNLTAATAATINQLRESWQVQRLLERDARGGTRLTEIIRSHFGVVSEDQRLQRPEYLGGGSMRINAHPVPRVTQVGAASEGPPLAELGAFGVGQVDGIGFNKSFTEHGFVIGLVNVRADLTYQQGLDRMWSRKTRYEYYWPAFAHLGEQAVLNKEIFLQDTAADDQVFGYQERYAEYRYKPSRVCNEFRSTSAAPIDSWHLALDFASLPILNDVFIEDNPPMDRVLSISRSVVSHFFGDFWHELRCARPMPTYSVPGLVDHF